MLEASARDSASWRVEGARGERVFVLAADTTAWVALGQDWPLLLDPSGPLPRAANARRDGATPRFLQAFAIDALGRVRSSNLLPLEALGR